MELFSISGFITALFSILICAWTIYFLVPFLENSKIFIINVKKAINQLPKDDYLNQFTTNYHNINDYFTNHRYFSHLWKEFTEHLIPPDLYEVQDKNNNSKEYNSVFRNSIRPQKFFTLDHLFLKNINFKLIESTPGVLLSIGILGTFVGLTVALFSLKTQLGSENVTEAINELIQGAGISFITSIFGLSASLCFSYFLNDKISQVKVVINNFNFKLEECLKFATAEDLLIKNLKELNQHGNSLDAMVDKIALKIGDQIGEKMKESFEKDEFSNKHIESVNNSFNKLQDTILPLISKISESDSTKQSMNHNILEQLEKSTKSYREHLDHITENLNTFVNQLKHTISGIDDITNKNLKEISIRFEKTTQQQEYISDKNEQYANTLKILSDQLMKNSDSTSKLSVILPDSIQSLDQIWQNYEKRFKNIDESATKLFEQLREGLQLVSKESAEYVDKLYKQSSQVTNNFAQSVDDLKEDREDYKDILNQITQNLKKVG